MKIKKRDKDENDNGNDNGCTTNLKVSVDTLSFKFDSALPIYAN